jgi:hypothetical protein
MKLARPLSLCVMVAVLTAAPVGNALAQSPRNTVARVQKNTRPAPKAVAPKTRKVSSFAPHPTKRRVFGAPIQPPIVNKSPPPKPHR